MADKAYKLVYVELVHRHHKRTPYGSNVFPGGEDIPWICDGEGELPSSLLPSSFPSKIRR